MAKISKFKEYSFTESIVDDFIKHILISESKEDEQSEHIEYILKTYKERFGDKKPSHQEFADFYHELRSDGIDGLLIFDTLDDVVPNPEEEEIDKDDTTYKRIERKILSDLKLDTKLVFTFGAGIGALYPVVSRMMSNMSLGVEIGKETIVLLTIAAISIVYLEEKKVKPEDEEKLTKDSKSMLEELRMRGIGDGIVKKVIKALQSVKNIFSTIAKHIGAAVGGIIDMFTYTSILIPIMNAVSHIIGLHHMSVDDVISNFFTLSVGIATRIAKYGLVEILDKLRKFISPNSKREILSDLETPVVQKFGDFTHGDLESEEHGDLIKEQ